MVTSKQPSLNPGWPDVSEAVRRVMRGNKAKDTAPELKLRSLVHRMGYRFRTHVDYLPGHPDLAFSARYKAIWLHGCFWHSHPGCRYATTPRTRVSYWLPKLAKNRQRDAEHTKQLTEMGWETMVVWECELTNPEEVRTRLRSFLGPQRIVHCSQARALTGRTYPKGSTAASP